MKLHCSILWYNQGRLWAVRYVSTIIWSTGWPNCSLGTGSRQIKNAARLRDGSDDLHLHHRPCRQPAGRGPGLLEAIVSNDDNLSYGGIVSVHIGQDKCITTLTDDGICELKDMLADAQRSPERWNDFLQDFVDDPDIIARVKHQPPRLKSGTYEEN